MLWPQHGLALHFQGPVFIGLGSGSASTTAGNTHLQSHQYHHLFNNLRLKLSYLKVSALDVALACLEAKAHHEDSVRCALP